MSASLSPSYLCPIYFQPFSCFQSHLGVWRKCRGQLPHWKQGDLRPQWGLWYTDITPWYLTLLDTNRPCETKGFMDVLNAEKKVCVKLVNFQVKAMVTVFLCTVGYGSRGDLQGPGLHPGSLVGWEVVGKSVSTVSLACSWRWSEKRHRCVTVLSEKDTFLQDLWAVWATSWSTSSPSIFLFSFLAQQLLCRPKWSEWLPETTAISFLFINYLGGTLRLTKIK